MRDLVGVSEMKVLVAENEKQTLKLLSEILEKEGFLVLAAENGHDALELYKTEKPDFVCLDIMMPELNGYDVCKRIRENDSQTPIIFISGRTESMDRVVGLDYGADDYIIKPFDVYEVIARIRAITRRCLSENANNKDSYSSEFTMGDLSIIPGQLKALRGDEEISLSLRDVKILSLLNSKKGNYVDRNELLDVCWGEHIMPESRTVDWHISQLRKKVEIDPQNPTLIRTVHGIGYIYE